MRFVTACKKNLLRLVIRMLDEFGGMDGHKMLGSSLRTTTLVYGSSFGVSLIGVKTRLDPFTFFLGIFRAEMMVFGVSFRGARQKSQRPWEKRFQFLSFAIGFLCVMAWYLPRAIISYPRPSHDLVVFLGLFEIGSNHTEQCLSIRSTLRFSKPLFRDPSEGRFSNSLTPPPTATTSVGGSSQNVSVFPRRSQGF